MGTLWQADMWVNVLKGLKGLQSYIYCECCTSSTWGVPKMGLPPKTIGSILKWSSLGWFGVSPCKKNRKPPLTYYLIVSSAGYHQFGGRLGTPISGGQTPSWLTQWRNPKWNLRESSWATSSVQSVVSFWWKIPTLTRLIWWKPMNQPTNSLISFSE